MCPCIVALCLQSGVLSKHSSNISIDVPVLDILCKWSHVMCSILCQASFTLHGVFEEDLCVALISVPSFSVQICVTSMNKSVCLGIYQWMFGLFPLVVYYDEGCDDHSCTRLLWTDIFISLGYKSWGKTVGSYGNWHGKLSNCFSKVVTSIYSHPGNAGGHQCTNFSTFLQTFAIFFLKIIAILVDTE